MVPSLVRKGCAYLQPHLPPQHPPQPGKVRCPPLHTQILTVTMYIDRAIPPCTDATTGQPNGVSNVSNSDKMRLQQHERAKASTENLQLMVGTLGSPACLASNQAMRAHCRSTKRCTTERDPLPIDLPWPAPELTCIRPCGRAILWQDRGSILCNRWPPTQYKKRLRGECTRFCWLSSPASTARGAICKPGVDRGLDGAPRTWSGSLG